MVAVFPAAPYWQPRLAWLGQTVTGLDDIGQAVYIILATVKGQVPHRPDFGLDPMGYMDLPFPRLKPRLIRDVIKAIQTWEPRAVVSRVDVTPDQTGSGQVQVSVTWRPKTGTDLVTTEVKL